MVVGSEIVLLSYRIVMLMKLKKACVLISGICLCSFATAKGIEHNYNQLVKFGPRAVSTLPHFHTRNYLEKELRSMGYRTRREPFRYQRRKDRRTIVKMGRIVLEGRGFYSSINGVVNGVIAHVGGAGTAEDLNQANVKGKVAVIKRGKISFDQKIQNAQAAGAIAVIVINDKDQNFRGVTTETTPFPVLGLKSSMLAALKEGQKIKVKVNMLTYLKQGMNIIAFKPGVIQPKVLFGAHFDSVPQGPGVNDNLSGVLTLLDIAREQSQYPLGEQSYFVFFDAEEEGLQGSRAYVKSHTDKVKKLKAMINLDMVGVDVHPLKMAGSLALLGTARRLNLAEVTEEKLGRSDHIPFKEFGVPHVLLHRGLDQNYHQPTDQYLDFALIRQTSKVAQQLAGEIVKQEE